MTAPTSRSVPHADRSRAPWLTFALSTAALIGTASAEQTHKQLLTRPWSITPIACGQVIAASIDFPGEVDSFRFHGTAGDVVEIAVAGDPCCVFYLATVLAPSGASLGTFGSDVLVELALPETGRYSVRVTSYDLVFTGSYHIGLSCRDPLGPIVDDLDCGEVVTSAISSPAEVDWLTFDGQASDIVELTLVGEVCCVYFGAAVFAPSGVQVGSSISDALLELTLPETGQYAVRITSWDLAYAGTYHVGLSCRAPLGPVVEHLSCAEVVTSAISRPAEADWFSFDGQASDIVELTLTGDVCCVYYLATVFEPDGSLLGSFGSDALQELTLPVTGQYAVRVTSYDYAWTGTYSIGFSCRSPLGPVVADLTCGLPIPSTISRPAEVDYYTFEGVASDLVELHLTGDVCCVFYLAEVYAPSGTSLGICGSGIVHPLTLPETGTYAVRVSSYDYVFTGSYDIELVCP